MFQKIQNFIETTRQAMGSLFEIQPVDTRNLGIAENVEYGNSSNTKFARYLSLNARRAVNAFQGAFSVSDTDRAGAMTTQLPKPIGKNYAQVAAELVQEWHTAKTKQDKEAIVGKSEQFKNTVYLRAGVGLVNPADLQRAAELIRQLDDAIAVQEGKASLERQEPETAGLLSGSNLDLEAIERVINIEKQRQKLESSLHSQNIREQVYLDMNLNIILSKQQNGRDA